MAFTELRPHQSQKSSNMVKPVYILCCNNVIEDKTQNLVSAIGIAERMMVEQVVSKPNKKKRAQKTNDRELRTSEGLQATFFEAVAVWTRDESEAGKEFEHEWVMHFPGEAARPVGGIRTFRFSEDKELYRFRLGVGLGGLPQQNIDGIYRVESRVRKKGNKRWKSQEFPFRLIVRYREV